MEMNEGKFLVYNFNIKSLLLLLSMQVGDLQTMQFGSETANQAKNRDLM